MSKTGVSLRSKDAIESGSFGPGPATIKRARWVEYQYPKKGQKKGEKPRGPIAPVLLVTYERDGDVREEPYGIGTGWRIENKGLTLTPKNGQAGLPKTCNAMYLIESLESAESNPMPDDYLETPDQLDGVEVVLMLKPIERTFERDGQQETSKKSLLVVEEVTSAPWAEGSGKSKAKKKDDDDEEDDDDKPSKKSKSDDDDDDEEDVPKGKGKSKNDDDADEEDVDESAVEALCDLLADEGEAVKIADLGTLLKKRGVKKAVIARIEANDFLDKEKGWTLKGSKVVAD